MKMKYRNKPVTYDGITFHSGKEGGRYLELRLLEKAGIITDLETQPVYRIEINGKLVCKVIPDFRYIENGERKVEDVKSPPTRKNPTYRLKNKLLDAVHGVKIIEI